MIAMSQRNGRGLDSVGSYAVPVMKTNIKLIGCTYLAVAVQEYPLHNIQPTYLMATNIAIAGT